MKDVKNYNLLFHVNSVMLDIFLYCFFWPGRVARGIFIPKPGIEPVPLAVEAWCLNHWATREVPQMFDFRQSLCSTQKTTKLGFC